MPYAPCTLHYIGYYCYYHHFYNGWPVKMGLVPFWQPSTLCFELFELARVRRIGTPVAVYDIHYSIQISGRDVGGNFSNQLLTLGMTLTVPYWRHFKMVTNVTYAAVTCDIKLFQKYFNLRRRPSEIILFQRVETCPKLFQNYFTGLL